MTRFKTLLTGLALGSALLFAPVASMAAPAGSPLDDGKLSEEELVQILASAQQQLIHLSEVATSEYEAELKDGAPNMPAAWMLMKDGKTVKRISLGEEGERVPAAAQIYMYRAAIKAIADQGEINAAAILYTGRLSKEDDTEVLVVEHEHRLGVSGNKVVAYALENGALKWSEPVTQKKPFEWFYDSKDGEAAE